MQRRRFLVSTAAAGSAALAPPLARHVANVLGDPPAANGYPRRQRATVLIVCPPADWRPQSWRDVPPVNEGTAYRVVGSFASEAVGICRQVAKSHNRRRMEDGVGTWAIVAATDGRFTAGTEGTVAA